MELSGRFDLKSATREGVGDRRDMFGFDALDRDAFAADRARDQESSRFDPVGNDVVLCAVQFRDAFDDQAARARRPRSSRPSC